MTFLAIFLPVAFIMTVFLPFQEVFARCIVGPNEPCILHAEPEIVDSSGNKVAEIFTGQEVSIQLTIISKGNSERPYVYIVLIKDHSGFTEQLSWTSGIVKQNETVTASVPWKPEKTEDYTTVIFVWDNLEKPEVFDIIRVTTVTVFPPTTKQ